MSETAVAHAQIPLDIRAQLETLARENERSLAAEIRLALREHVRRELIEETVTTSAKENP